MNKAKIVRIDITVEDGNGFHAHSQDLPTLDIGATTIDKLLDYIPKALEQINEAQGKSVDVIEAEPLVWGQRVWIILEK